MGANLRYAHPEHGPGVKGSRYRDTVTDQSHKLIFLHRRTALSPLPTVSEWIPELNIGATHTPGENNSPNPARGAITTIAPRVQPQIGMVDGTPFGTSTPTIVR
ncbi:hypothetical protein WA026_016052 [Henosepilachna vigintioctopunctata]|uniref:Uncharacterized protein n=1 Tax=Henosepilachna vigintioctopunctata TaxID=420089 RepID=A0AAW1UAG6_9CUCU